MASSPPTISEASTKRPWYKKKRYVIPLSIVLGAGFLGALDEPVDEGVDSSEGGTAEMVVNARPPIIEGVMPDYVGYTAREVWESREALGTRRLRLPIGLEPNDDDFEVEADKWFVCEQEQPAGEELEFSYEVWLGYATNCAEYKVVPDMVGMTLRDAYHLAQQRGLVLDESDFDNTVCEQDKAPGSTIPAGNLPRREEEIDVVTTSDCEVYYAQKAEREAEEERRAQEEAERAERERILNDPNTFEGGRRFINFHTDWLRNDIALIDEYRRWLEAGARIDDPDSFGGPILDAIFGDIPYMPQITDDMWEQAPADYQERWDDIRQRLDEADEAHDEANDLRREDIYSISEELPYVADVRALVVEALRLVESMPYPQQ